MALDLLGDGHRPDFFCFARVFVITEGSWELNGKSLSVMVFIEALDALGGTMGVKVLILINFAWNQAGVVGLD